MRFDVSWEADDFGDGDDAGHFLGEEGLVALGGDRREAAS